jgi:hypothetical protein
MFHSPNALNAVIRSLQICHDPIMFFMQIRIAAERTGFDIAGIKACTVLGTAYSCEREAQFVRSLDTLSHMHYS